MEGREGRMGSGPEGAPAARAGGRPARLSPDTMIDGREADEREAKDREVTQNRDVSDDERLEMFRDAHLQSILPDLPRMDGYHVCWLTTSNPRDSIQHRIRLGYELIRAETCPEFGGVLTRNANYDGIIGINEMVAARIPLRIYNKFMSYAHYEAPLAEEEKLKANVERVADELDQYGSGLVEIGDGTAALVQKAKPQAGWTS